MFNYITSSLLVVSVLGGAADYTLNGADWPELCQTGLEQSPIDLTTDTDTSDKMEIIGYNYYDFVKQAGFSDTDFSQKIDFDDNQLRANAELQITFADESQSYFTPKQFHFHAPSEHTVNGYLYDAEVHLVHVYKGSGTTSAGVVDSSEELYGAVIGIFFDMIEGGSTSNPFVDSVFAAIEDPTKKVAMRQFLSTVDMRDYWSYDGSFTTPPCTEGIKWSVIKQVQSISQAQLDRFKALMVNNP